MPATSFRDTASFDSDNSSTGIIQIPAGFQTGDGMFLLVNYNNGGSVTLSSGPSGWTQQGTDQVVTTRTSALYARIATSTDPGANVTVTLSAATKWQMEFWGYAGIWADLASFIDDIQVAVDGSAGTSHSAPSATVNVSGDWGVLVVTEKSSSTTSITGPTTPTGITQRINDVQGGGGAFNTLVMDSNGAVA